MKINREAKTGLLVTISIAMLIWGINYLKGRNILSSEKTFYAVYEKVDGLTESAPILVNGYNIGKVSKIELKQGIDNQLVLTLGVGKKYEIPLNTVAQIQSTDFIGGKAVVLLFPEQKSGYHQPGDTLTASYDEGIDAILSKVENTADDLVTSLDSVLLSLNNILDTKTQMHVKGIFENLDKVTNELHVTLAQGGDLEQSIENLQNFSGALASNAENFDNMSANLTDFTDTLAHLELNQTVNELNMVLEQSKIMLETVNSAEGTAGKILHDDSLYVNINKVSVRLEELLADLKENPKRYVHFSLFGRKDKNDEK